MKAFVLIVTFAAAGATEGDRTERIAGFDDYQACAAAGRALYSQQHWECVPENQHPKDAPVKSDNGSRAASFSDANAASYIRNGQRRHRR